MSSINRRVVVFNPADQSFTEMPARELAPGMIRVKIEGHDEECWMDSAQVQMGSFKHHALPEQLLADVGFVQFTFAEVFHRTLTDWVDGFRRDNNPETEVAIWKHMAQVYVELNKRQMFDEAQRKDIFSVLVACTLSDRANILNTARIRSLSREDAERVVKEFLGSA